METEPVVDILSLQPQVYRLLNALWGVDLSIDRDGRSEEARLNEFTIFSVSRALVVNAMLGVSVPIGRENTEAKYFEDIVSGYGKLTQPEEFDYESAQARISVLIDAMLKYHSLNPRDDGCDINSMAIKLNRNYGLKLLGNNRGYYVDRETRTIPNSLNLLDTKKLATERRTRVLSYYAGKLIGSSQSLVLPSAALLEVARNGVANLFATFQRKDGKRMHSIEGKELVEFTNGLAADLKQKGSMRQAGCMDFNPAQKELGGNPVALQVLVGDDIQAGKRILVNTLELRQPGLIDCVECPVLGLCHSDHRQISFNELERLALNALYEQVYQAYTEFLET